MTNDATTGAKPYDPGALPGLPSGYRPWPALWALVVGFFMILVDSTIVSVANPAIKAALDPETNNLDNVVWVTSAYLLAYAVPLLITGRLGDRFGPKNIYLIGLAIFTLASLACGLSPTLGALIAFRAVQGFGGSLLNPQSLSVINRVFARHRRGAAMGVWSAVAGSAGLFGPVIGGLLAGGVGWRWVFLLYLPLGLVALALVARWVPRLPTGVGRIDLLSAVVSLVAVLGIVFTLQQGPELGWPLWLSAVAVMGVLLLRGHTPQEAGRPQSAPRGTL